MTSLNYYQKAEYRVLLNVHYHMICEQFNKRLYRTIGTLSALGSTSAAFSLWGDHTEFAKIVTFIIAAMLAFDWFFDFRGASSKHNELKVRNIDLQKTLQLKDDSMSKADFNKFVVKLLEIDKSEEPTNGYFYNQAKKLADDVVLGNIDG